jgi:arylsulfatase A-like enzyme
VTGIYDYRGFSTYNNGHIKLLPKAYITDYVRGATARAIERFDREDRKPFFIWASYVAPHRSTGKNCKPGVFCQALPIPAERHRNRYPDALPGSLTKPSFNEDDMSDKPPYMQLFPKLERRLVVREHRARIRALASVDEAVAGTLRTLKRHGELDRTLVVFTSDNGFVMGEHRYVGKVLPYQESVRVPLLVRGPGVARGAVSSQLATTFDLTKTFTDLAGARPGRRLDGVSLTPYLQDPGQTDRRPHTLIQSGGIGWGFDIDGWTYRGYRDPRYTFARYAGGFMELYDRDVDPYELNNLASEPGYTLLRRELLARTRTLSSCAGATCRQGFDPVPTPGGRRLAAQNRLRGGRPALD